MCSKWWRHAPLVWPEYAQSDNDEDGELWVARSLDLTARNFTNAEARFDPLLTSLPYDVSNRQDDLEDPNTPEMFLLPEGESVMAIFNSDPSDDSGGHGRFFVNVLTPTGVSRPALLTSDKPESLPDDDNGFTVDDVEYLVVPGARCDNAVGAWFLYVRNDQNANSGDDVNYIQARHFTSVSLPR